MNFLRVMLFVVAFGSLTQASAGSLDSSFLRLKSGINSPVDNADVTHFTPLAVDLVYRFTSSFGIGLHGMYSSGSHATFDVRNSQLTHFHLSKKMGLSLVSGNYFLNFGNARIGVGVKAGALYYSDSTSLAAGLSNTLLPPDHSKTLFTAGPALDIDLPLIDSWFVNVGGDYMFSEDQYHFGSLYVGLGLSL